MTAAQTQAQAYARQNYVYMQDDTAKFIVIGELTTLAEEFQLNHFRFPDGSILIADPDREQLRVAA